MTHTAIIIGDSGALEFHLWLHLKCPTMLGIFRKNLEINTENSPSTSVNAQEICPCDIAYTFVFYISGKNLTVEDDG